jgi:hypothetical protein
MNKKLKLTLLLLALTVSLVLMSACGAEPSQYEKYDSQGYTVSVKYDANGGSFGTNTSVVCDTYNPSLLDVNESGKAELILLPPDSSVRNNPSSVKNSGYFLAGWYSVREPILDSEGNHLDYDGNVAKDTGKTPAYTYSGRWDFEDGRFEIDPDGSYSSASPVLTLYAAWVPEFTFEFHTMAGELIDTLRVNPLVSSELTLPEWKGGKMVYNDFPTSAGKTFNAAYLGAADGERINEKTLVHTGVFDPADASYSENVVRIFVDYLDGEWYYVSSADELISNANPSANYVLTDDLDFEGKSWPLSGTFRGSIHGEGHSIKNITVSQGSISNNGGIFATVASGATIENLSFENATYRLMKGSRTNGAKFGLLAGTVADGATVTGVTLDGKILISPDALIPTDYSIGLVAGLGYDKTGIDYSHITVEAMTVETSLYEVSVTVSGNDVYVTVGIKGKD